MEEGAAVAPKKRYDKPCARCGGEKLPGRGQRLCASCRDDALKEGSTRNKGEITPCRRCGKTEDKEHGKQYCRKCIVTQKRLKTVRRRKKRAAERLPCKGCGGLKERGPRRRYCDLCLARREVEAEQPRKCSVCKQMKVTAKYAIACDHCRSLTKGERDSMRERPVNIKSDEELQVWREKRRLRVHKQGEAKRLKARKALWRKKRLAERREEAEKIKNSTKTERVMYDKMEPYVTEWLKYNGRTVSLLEQISGMAENSLARKQSGKEKTIPFNTADAVLLQMGIEILNVYDESEIFTGKSPKHNEGAEDVQ